MMSNFELMPDFIQNIDWQMFKKQRLDLIKSIDDFEIKAKEAGSAGEEKLCARYKQQADSLQGLLHLTDAITDYASDFGGLDADKIALTEKE